MFDIIVRLPYNITMSNASLSAFQILDTLMSINAKLNLIDKHPRVYRDIKIFPSQIRAIVIIRHSPGINITNLAGSLNISKASASEMVTRLVETGLVTKTKDADNTKEVALNITEKCQPLCRDINAEHSRMFKDLKSSLREFYETDSDIVVRVLQKIDFYLEKFVAENQ